MSIGIDTFACDSGESGVGIYTTQLIKRMHSQGAHIELFGWAYDRYVFNEAMPDLHFIPCCRLNGYTANNLWHFLYYPGFARKRGYTACFFPAAHKQIPFRSSCPSIGTVHDLAAFGRGPGTWERFKLARWFFRKAFSNLDRVITVSQWVKQELMDIANVKEDRIVVVPNGIDCNAFFPRPQNEESVIQIQPFSFQRPYILYVSRLEHPIKNHLRLIQAFTIFKDKTGYPHRLVLAGSDSQGAATIKEAAGESPYRSEIFFTDHFPSASLPELNAGADFAVFPSMYEGFGLGILEAMASGVPVACALAASLPEAAGDAALYFDPLNVEEMADRMVTLATDRAVARECRQRGLERSKVFSWDACATRTLEIIQETAR